MPSPPRRAALVTLGCARNEVDSEELAGRLAAGGWEVADDADDADVVLVNTCGVRRPARRRTRSTRCWPRRDGGRARWSRSAAWPSGTARELAASLPEADAVLGFDAYAEIGDRLDDVLAGRAVAVAHARATGARCCRSRRCSGRPPPARSPSPATAPAIPARAPRSPARRVPAGRRRCCAAGSTTRRSPRSSSASGCDRRCSFCAIPSFRGAFVSRPAEELLAEARWLADQGVRELVLVSENSTSYGKDLGDLRLLEALLPELAAVAGIVRVRVSYLQPAETRPSLVEAIAGTPGRRAVLRPVLPARQRGGAAPDAPLRRHRAVPGAARRRCARLAPAAGVRSNVIVGFPGETRADVAELSGS